MRKGICVFLCMVLLCTMLPVSVSAENEETRVITVDTGNGNRNEYEAVLEEDKIYLRAEDIAEIGGYTCSIDEKIRFSREPGSEWFQFDLALDGTAHVQGYEGKINIKEEKGTYYLPVEELLYFMHTTWCVEDYVLYVNTLSYSLHDFFADYEDALYDNQITEADLLTNGGSEELGTVRSSLANMLRNFDTRYYIPTGKDEEVATEEYEDILMELTKKTDPYAGAIPSSLIEEEIKKSSMEQLSADHPRASFIADLGTKLTQTGTDVKEIIEMYDSSGSVTRKIMGGESLGEVYGSNLGDLTEKLGQAGDALAIFNGLCNISDVAQKAEQMSAGFTDQIRILSEADPNMYQGSTVNTIKKAADNLIQTKESSMNAAGEKAVEETLNIVGTAGADLTFTGKAVAALQTGDILLDGAIPSYESSMEAAQISYKLRKAIDLEFIALQEMSRFAEKLYDSDDLLQEEDLKKIRDSALLYLRLNLQDKAYLYYLNTINNKVKDWESSSQAQQQKQEMAETYAMYIALEETTGTDGKILMGDSENFYCDEEGKTRERISGDILQKPSVSVFEAMPSDFIFASGAGAWSTDIHLNQDGTFSGQFHDSDAGVNGDGYPYGTKYICNFKGEFTQPEQKDDFTYKMSLKELKTEGTPGAVYFEDGIKHIYAAPYGLENADELIIYAPGIALSELPEECLSWLTAYGIGIQKTQTLPYYVIYSVNDETGFVGWQSNQISQEETAENETKDSIENPEDRISKWETAANELEAKIEQGLLTQHELNMCSKELYDTWDDCLNVLWNDLEEGVRERLLDEQVAWVQEKEQKMEEAGNQHKGGSMEPMVRNLEGARITKERVYELLNYF